MRQVLLGSGLSELTDAKSMDESGIVHVFCRPGEPLVSAHVDVDRQARCHGAPACHAHNERRRDVAVLLLPRLPWIGQQVVDTMAGLKTEWLGNRPVETR